MKEADNAVPKPRWLIAEDHTGYFVIHTERPEFIAKLERREDTPHNENEMTVVFHNDFDMDSDKFKNKYDTSQAALMAEATTQLAAYLDDKSDQLKEELLNQ